MKRAKRSIAESAKAIVLSAVFLTVGCSAWDIAEKDDITHGPGDSYSVELPAGWVRFRAERQTLILTRDGYALQQIVILKKKGKDAFPKTKKEAKEGLLPSELAEIQLAELKQTNELTGNLEVLENAPAELSGKLGYKLHVRFKTSRGLPYEQLIYGLCDKQTYYAMGFAAPSLYYFDRHKAEFEQMVASFKLKSKG